MKKYIKIKKLESTEFRRLTGVKPETFLEMVAILYPSKLKNRHLNYAKAPAVERSQEDQY
jgi:hypothetical protein